MFVKILKLQFFLLNDFFYFSIESRGNRLMYPAVRPMGMAILKSDMHLVMHDYDMDRHLTWVIFHLLVYELGEDCDKYCFTYYERFFVLTRVTNFFSFCWLDFITCKLLVPMPNHTYMVLQMVDHSWADAY